MGVALFQLPLLRLWRPDRCYFFLDFHPVQAEQARLELLVALARLAHLLLDRGNLHQRISLEPALIGHLLQPS